MSLKVLCVCATSALHGQQCRQVQCAVLPPLKKGKKIMGLLLLHNILTTD